MVTKEYGFTVDDIDWSCPADLEPYAKAYELQIKQQDEQMYLMGIYIISALDSTVCNSFLWRKKEEKAHKYMEKPIMYEYANGHKNKNEGELSDEERKEQTEKLFMQLRIMGANFNINHKN